MPEMKKLLFALLIALLMAPLALAQEEGEAEEGEEPAGEIEDVIIVTASRTEQSMHEVPSAFSVITSEQLETMPADDVGDLLRNLPGVNVTQTSARDIQVSSRSATSTLATDQLVLLDGRTLYLDFFGFVMWDFLPVNSKEIKQIEVVRGPGSAVWGANAMTGVINVITKSPKEMAGTSLILGGGEFDTLYGSVTHAGASEDFGYKVSLGYYQQDPFPRPEGIIPGSDVRNPPFGTPFPAFNDPGTEQPKVDLRFDWDLSDTTTFSLSGGYAGTDGLVHTGIGPFDVESGSNLAYLKGSWRKNAKEITFFANLLDGDAPNVLTRGPDGLPLQLGFESQTYNLEYNDTKVIGEKHILTYGGRIRRNEFELSIAPDGTDRDEFGVYLQDEILFGEKVRWLVGARVDDLDPIDTVVSPRTSLMFSPSRDHTFRVSFNKAFRQPSLINNFLKIGIVNQAFVDPRLISAAIAPPGVPCEFVLTTCDPFLLTFASAALGNPKLEEEEMDAFEVGYVGTFGGTTVAVSAYRNELTNGTDFFEAEFYSPTSPPAGWPVFIQGPLPIPAVPPGVFPSVFSYRNIGESINEGIEISVNSRWSNGFSFFANYTYQADPDVTGQPPETFNLPPNNRFNIGLAYDAGTWFVNGNVNHTDEAFWTDVLDSRFWGPTDEFTIANLSFGVRLLDEKLTFTVIGTNIFDEDFQAHVFGDIIPRKISGQIQINF